jgi:DNA-binding response OmpR family regulator
MKVLLVEDEHKIARAISLGFKQEKAVVEVAYDGEEGLSAALGDEYDVIILDRMLPGGMDGVEICRRILDS